MEGGLRVSLVACRMLTEDGHVRLPVLWLCGFVELPVASRPGPGCPGA